MNSTVNLGTSGVVNIRSIIWELLSQWKAVLLFAILFSMIVSGMKYSKDMSAYNDAVERQKEESAHTEIPADEKIEEILAPLSAADRSDVVYIIKAKDWVRMEEEYLNNSILLNTDPTNQRAVLLDYQITTDDPGDMTAVVYGYIGRMYSQEMLEKVGAVIDPGADTRYIAELFTNDLSKYTNIEQAVSDMVFEIRLVIPEGIDADVAEQAVTSCFKEYSGELTKRIGGNQISLLSAAEYRRYNIDIINIRNNITYSVYNVQNNIKNGGSFLSDKAKSAIAAIDAIKAAEYEKEAVKNVSDDSAEVSAEPGASIPVKPGLSKKYAALGLILGVILYAFLYMLFIILHGRLTSATYLGYYTGSRLLGEVYSEDEIKGIRRLLHSRLVDKVRYRRKLDVNRQLEKIISTVEAFSTHTKTDSISMICLPGLPASAASLIGRVADGLKEKGIVSEIFSIENQIDENKLNTIEKAVIVCGCDSKASSLVELAELCREYEVRQIGNIYMRSI